MVKYASNAFHSLKVAFANEIAAVCQHAQVDAEAVMNVFCSDTKLNISGRSSGPAPFNQAPFISPEAVSAIS